MLKGVPLPHGDTAGTTLAVLCHCPRSLHGLKEDRKRDTSEDGAWKGAWCSPQNFTLGFSPSVFQAGCNPGSFLNLCKGIVHD